MVETMIQISKNCSKVLENEIKKVSNMTKSYRNNIINQILKIKSNNSYTLTFIL